MSYSGEQYPSVAGQIHFKPHDDLVNDPGYPLHAWPSLERPRRLSLSLHNPNGWKTLPRDYCVVHYPTRPLQEDSKVVKDVTLKMFHSDILKLPDGEIWPRFQEYKDWTASYLNYWYLQGITQSSVENMFKKHFNFSIPLTSTSSAGHWMPAPQLYTVEVQENVWEGRLAIFFHGNVETSFQSVGELLGERGTILNAKHLGQQYVHSWRSKWEKMDLWDQNLAPSNSNGTTLKSTKNTPPRTITDTNLLTPKPRGRKRRALLRQLRTGPSELNLETNVDLSTNTPSPAARIPATVRGRLRRRERRKNKFNKQKSQPAPSQEEKVNFTEPNSSYDIGNASLKPGNSDIARWTYNNGELASKYGKQFVPVGLSIDFGGSRSETPNQNSKTAPSGLEDSHQEAFSLRNNIPILTIRALHASASLPKAKKFHIISYFNPTSRGTTISYKLNDSKRIETEEERKPSYVQPYEIHVADLIDETGAVNEGERHGSTLFSVIEANPSAIKSSKGLDSAEFDVPLPSKRVRNQYWHKFSSLLYGFTDPEDARRLPYSPGYGLKHNSPILIVKQNRWGFFDIDHVCDKSQRPHWRAAWRFETTNGSDKCGCDQHGISHDLRSCYQMNREQFKANIQPWDHDLAPGEILPSLLQFVHKPYETLSVLEQNKYFPPPKNNSHGFGSGNILETSGEIEQPTNEARHKMLENIAEQNFEKGVCSLMGLGMFKDIIVGVQLIQSSAEQGCTRARAIGSSIGASYDIQFNVPAEILENWLREASLHGSRLALEELRSRFPDTHREVVAINRFVFDLNCPDVFNYTKHILPHFDLGNVSRLESQIKSFKLERETETGTTSSISTLAAMEIRNKNFPRSCYVFGSLLHLACLFGFLDAAALLIGYCFDIDAQNTHPALRTPLLCALSRGQSAIAKLLISKGASCVPLLLWSEEKILCSTPSPLHYLVNVESDSEAKELARLLVKGGADVNCKCEVGYLMSQNPTEIPVLKGRSVTPLRWAIIHQKAQLVKALLNLGAKFAFETYLRHPTEDKEDSDTEKRGYILLETPCTDLDILAMFFARARVPGLPIEFSQTPLGLLVSEDDGPERRLRPGFESFDKIRDALDLLLELQPGHEDILLWSAVRHDHVEIVQYLLEHRRFPIESRWRGLTMLHTAVLYGRVDLVRYLLHQGADAVAVTEKRHLTCLHLLMLVPRDRKTDQEILDCILYCGIEVDTRESCDDLTALHLAVRNRKICCVKTLLDIGADPSIPVKDQLSIIAQGKSGLLSHIPSPSQIFTPNLTILGEVIIQYLQDKFYSYDYVADLLFLFLDHKRQPLTSADLVIDSGNGITILHLLALITHPSEESPIPKTKYNPPPSPPQPDTALISLLQLVLLRCAPSSVNVFDSQNDTPLHFACAAHNLSNIQALLSFGGEPTLINSLGLNPLDILLWSTFFIKGKTLTFWSAEKSWHPKIDYGIRNDSVVKHSHDAPTVLSSAINIFQDLGWNIDERLRRLALAWDYATNEENLIIFSLLRQRNDREHVELVPEGSAKGIQVGEEGERDPDRVKEYGTSGIRRNYWVATVRGAVRNKAVREGEVMFGYEDNDEVEGK